MHRLRVRAVTGPDRPLKRGLGPSPVPAAEREAVPPHRLALPDVDPAPRRDAHGCGARDVPHQPAFDDEVIGPGAADEGKMEASLRDREPAATVRRPTAEAHGVGGFLGRERRPRAGGREEQDAEDWRAHENTPVWTPRRYAGSVKTPSRWTSTVLVDWPDFDTAEPSAR